MPFQTVVNPFASSIPLGVEGDFCSANPRASKLAGEGNFVAGVNPVIVGRFGWADATGKVQNNAAGFVSVGFVPLRGQMVLITPYLGSSSLQIQPGYDMTVLDSADVLIRFAAGAAIGQKVFASYSDGTGIAGAAGSTPAGAAFTGSLASSGVLTVASGLTGLVKVGQPVSGAGITVGTYVTAQLTGTAGGIGTYSTLPTGQTVSSEAMTTAAGLETRWFVDSLAGNGELAMCSTRG